MRTAIFILLLSSFVSAQDTKPVDLPTNKAIAAEPAPLSDSVKLNLYALADKVNDTLSKVKTLPYFSDWQKASEDADRAKTTADGLQAKILSTPEGKAYAAAAKEDQAALADALKGVDQTKWKLGPGLKWQAVEQAKDTPEKK